MHTVQYVSLMHILQLLGHLRHELFNKKNPKEQDFKQFPLINLKLLMQLVQFVGELVHVTQTLLHFRQLFEL